MNIQDNTVLLHEQWMLRRFASLIPEGVRFSVKIYNSTPDIDDLSWYRQHCPLSDLEQKDIQNAIPKREVEYRTARLLARTLLGVNPQDTHISLHKKENGAPDWPADITGSISHSGSVCIVAQTDVRSFEGIGIDVEYGEFKNHYRKFILSSNEELLNKLGKLSELATLRALFCCKEAAFKALERYLHERIYFKDLAINFTKPLQSNTFEFEARLINSRVCIKHSPRYSINGRIYADDKMALSVAFLMPGFT